MAQTQTGKPQTVAKPVPPRAVMPNFSGSGSTAASGGSSNYRAPEKKASIEIPSFLRDKKR